MESKKVISLLIGICLIHLLLFIAYLILYWGISNQQDFALNNYSFVLDNIPILWLIQIFSIAVSICVIIKRKGNFRKSWYILFTMIVFFILIDFYIQITINRFRIY